MRFIVLAVVVSAVYAQTCRTPNGYGPCMNGNCLNAGDLCISGSCCAKADVLPANCVDKINPSTGVSDCLKMASYCTNSLYYDLMTKECPKTCNRCGIVVTTTKAACVDKKNPSTGVSDCASRKAYCTNSLYYDLMTRECPKTCGRC